MKIWISASKFGKIESINIEVNLPAGQREDPWGQDKFSRRVKRELPEEFGEKQSMISGGYYGSIKNISSR
ncbi:hypothetical protein [Lacrimispora sp.]|uniref:hypothetical protein n=1 Tax=Lacrimispora sp. TaxID=2719234 RepID=UPI00345FF37A